MKRKLFAAIVAILLLASVLAVYAISFTADSARGVAVPVAALATICQVDETTGECTDRRGEILFGNAIIENFVGDKYGLLLLQFGNEIYVARGGAVYNQRITTTDGKIVEALSSVNPEDVILEGSEIQSVERLGLVGIKGTLSSVLRDGSEISTTGDTITIEDVKGTISFDEPLGELFVSYDGLELESYTECEEYTNLVEGVPVKGVSTRECRSATDVMIGGDYRDLEIIFNQLGESRDKYRLVSVDATTHFEWVPSEGRGGSGGVV